jgi:multimeric flavodoxin WrbA
VAKVIVVYHSGYGHTKVVAERVAEGAGANLIEISADGEISEADWQALDEADAIVFGAPTYMGNASWQFKRFADASSKRWFSQAWIDKVFGGFTNSASPSGDKQVTLIGMQTRHLGQPWPSAQQPQGRDPCRYQQPRRFGWSAGAFAVGCFGGRGPQRRS